MIIIAKSTYLSHFQSAASSFTLLADFEVTEMYDIAYSSIVSAMVMFQTVHFPSFQGI